MKLSEYFVFIMASILRFVSGEVFTSMANMENLAQTEKNLLTSFKTYLRVEQQRLQVLQTFLKHVDNSHHGQRLENPVDIYLMLRRLSVEWKDIEQHFTQDPFEQGDFKNVYRQSKSNLPNSEDLTGAMDALFRLQDVYKLSATTLAQGMVPGVKGNKSPVLGLSETFELGRHAYDSKDYIRGKDWMRLAFNEMGDDEEKENVKKTEILDYLAYCEFEEGSMEESFNLYKELARLQPDEKRTVKNLNYVYQQLAKSKSTETQETGNEQEEEEEGEENEIDIMMKSYRKLCRGDVRKQTIKEVRHMKCWYKTNDPVLKFKPQKVERIWMNPEILVMREILDNKQTEQIKDTAYPILERATTVDPDTKETIHAHYRVSKSAWLSPSEYEFVRKIGIRTQAVTGLDVTYAEKLQVANYGIGGHYEPHFDHSYDGEHKFTEMGNRIATILFYLSEVQAGGATVFTIGETAVFPSKGDAVFWFNLKRNGSGDSQTLHAGCPVLVGTKWISNWWFHEHGQEFRRPCALDKNL